MSASRRRSIGCRFCKGSLKTPSNPPTPFFHPPLIQKEHHAQPRL
ncbi:hypothetical protein GCWU000324_01731 [Kingella oralis ATCC 51147]|uniref:Uncharacterized protein n=1 Tax=Kingella oralis ATCC 51147 TaxID=629741 RepID=C4GL74_9NEIS|nr:hypothetical protein GCWU000324_01731 [Kingella oralis ATCC 51147]